MIRHISVIDGEGRAPATAPRYALFARQPGGHTRWYVGMTPKHVTHYAWTNAIERAVIMTGLELVASLRRARETHPEMVWGFERVRTW